MDKWKDSGSFAHKSGSLAHKLGFFAHKSGLYAQEVLLDLTQKKGSFAHKNRSLLQICLECTKKLGSSAHKIGLICTLKQVGVLLIGVWYRTLSVFIGLFWYMDLPCAYKSLPSWWIVHRCDSPLPRPFTISLFICPLRAVCICVLPLDREFDINFDFSLFIEAFKYGRSYIKKRRFRSFLEQYI